MCVSVPGSSWIGRWWIGVLLFVALCCLAARPLAQTAGQSVSPDAAEFFETQIRPVLVENCTSCHSGNSPMAGLRLDSRAALLQGGAHGPAIVPGKPDQSLLLNAVRYAGKVKMPPTGKLPQKQIDALTAWVKMGAPWPDAKAPAASSTYVITPPQRNFWSFQPVHKPKLPTVKNRAWVRSPIDAFILAKLEEKGLEPAPQADRRTLIRRATFDLTGLPPTPAEIDAFLKDRSPGAFAKVVDRLLASPRYGERWGRHWLDVVRYCDSLDVRALGSEGDIGGAWRYRDWVVNALNHDLPYDQFVMNQIAGDLLPGPIPGDINVEGTIATGMLAIGNWGNGDADKEKILTDIADDQVDVVSRGFMGLTVGCARCHNHKFDPIPTTDYYGLAGIFSSTHILPKLTPKGQGELLLRIPLQTKAEAAQQEQLHKQIANLQQSRDARAQTAAGTLARSLLPQTAQYLTAAWNYAAHPALQQQSSLEAYARSQGLRDWALRHWYDALGFSRFSKFNTTVSDVMGQKGIEAWKGKNDDPAALINTTNQPTSILTFTLPAHSVCVHPGPHSAAVISWRSPITGTIDIGGGVKDADPACGDGIAWILSHNTTDGMTDLASGDFPNGGTQDFAQGKGTSGLHAIKVHAGESIDLQVLPKGDYSCDMTFVDLRITAQENGRIWNLTSDLVDSPLAGNPHPDGYGNREVWSFGEGPSLDHPDLVLSSEALRTFREAAASGNQETVLAAAQNFAAAYHATDRSSPFTISSTQEEANLPAEDRSELAKLDAEIAKCKSALPAEMPYANGAQEGGVPESSQAGFHDVYVHIRGSYEHLGVLAPRHFPIILAGDRQPPITSGSGRLELARWIASARHPLTARVIVNRLWQHHFGEGIVRTPNNFGFLGERPTHPELLDWLASRLIEKGWSLKQLHREILLSATWQQSSTPSARTLKLDAGNRLFSRMNRQRLESEAIRDSMLTVSGALNLQMGGPAVRDFSAPRRTLYIMTIRSDRSGFGPLFDAADTTAVVDHRTASTVAPQALFLLNDPFVLSQSEALARRILAETPGSDKERIAAAYLLLYGRPPQERETQIGLSFLTGMRSQPSLRTVATNALDRDLPAWSAYCQALLCANEFIYID